MILWVTAALIFLLSALAAVLFLLARTGPGGSGTTQRRFTELLRVGLAADGAETDWVNAAVNRMGGENAARIVGAGSDEEITRLLKQAGWYVRGRRRWFVIASWLSPLAAVAAAVAYLPMAADMTPARAVALLFVAGTFGFLVPRWILRAKAKARRQAMSVETPVAIHLLRMLFDAGLTTEYALKVMREEGAVLMPNLAEEIGVALERIDAGHDRADALSDMAAPLEVPELTDTVAILKQVTRHGGNIRDSLLKFAQLIEERQQSALREYVSKLSAKMTVVMMVFLFPALLIFLAGPGFLALGRALGGMYG